MNAKSILLAVLSLCFFESCFAPEDTLTTGDLTLVDSFFRMQRETLRLELEDSCKDYRAIVLPGLIDSIRVERYAEIQKLIDEY